MHYHLRGFALALAAWLLIAAPVWARQEPHKVEKVNPAAGGAVVNEPGHTDQEHQASHSKPNVMDVRFDLTIWSIIIFAGLFLILRKYAWGPILEGLQKREKTIESSLEEAKKAREEVAAQRAEFEKRLAEANQEIPRLMEQARKDAELLKEEMRTQANADIQTERQRLRREIEVAKDQALHEIWSQAANLATVISARAIRRELSPDDHRRLIDEALEEVQALTKSNQGRSAEAGGEWLRQAGGRL
jgi:F-type H+-transporting ATPase subunit b